MTTATPTTMTSRRLRTMLTVVAAAALLLPACGERDATAPPGADRQPADSPVPTTAGTPGTATTEVPDDFPLTAGLPDTNGDDGSPVLTTGRPGWTHVELCGETVWSSTVPARSTDLAGASYAGAGADHRSRTLALYADDASARRAFDALRDAYVSCPEDGGVAGNVAQVREVVADQPGSLRIVVRPRPERGADRRLTVVQVVRAGNALFFATYDDVGGGSAHAVTRSVADAERSSGPVWDAMSVFAGTDPGPADDDLSGFPLTAGWPDRTSEPGQPGIVFPVDRSVPQAETDFASEACGDPAPDPAVTSTLRARYDDVVDHRVRSLLVFADADAAVAHVSGLRARYADCDDTGEHGFTSVSVTLDTEVGGQSFGVGRFELDRGNPTTALSVLHVVRVGRSVLVDTAYTEGGAGPETREAAAREQLDRMTVDSADVVAAQCAFTEAGC